MFQRLYKSINSQLLVLVFSTFLQPTTYCFFQNCKNVKFFLSRVQIIYRYHMFYKENARNLFYGAYSASQVSQKISYSRPEYFVEVFQNVLQVVFFSNSCLFFVYITCFHTHIHRSTQIKIISLKLSVTRHISKIINNFHIVLRRVFFSFVMELFINRLINMINRL